MRHIIDLNDIGPESWKDLYKRARDIMESPDDYRNALTGKVLAALFYEPSTRTSFSFHAAMQRLGGSVFGFSNPGTSSISKGESLKDTIIMCAGYSDAIVIRNPREGSSKAAAMFSSVPIINAGDGGHLHPTQTLTDLFTITHLRGEVGNMNIGICGDLKNGRTVHSLIKTLSKFDNIVYYLISPRELAIPSYLREYMRNMNMRFYESSGLDAAIPQLDVLYMTRIQAERFSDPAEYERLKGVYILKASTLKIAKKDLLIMHPLPRVNEIQQEVDNDPRAVYFDQARYGMFVRMALLLDLISEGRATPPYIPVNRRGHVCNNPSCITHHEAYLPAYTTDMNGMRYCAYCDSEIQLAK